MKLNNKPAITLTQIKSRKVEALVKDRIVNTEHDLHNEDIIRVSTLDVRYRLVVHFFVL